ncbi:hypothetical protein [Constantimarinum furrinae]|uniref:Uncharacterized protein n=1 Tax=Constantimarinum furrinae TaxID=2562285 RepID=A0A7G8PTP2_9FLAO|nr:hypothetical protein [Constantimarinum furrinae]QNJ97708.1 hypothetical protein ALE3EI_1137 [Constantimarinum furrinae]
MNKVKISINQLVDFRLATQNKKLRILRDQKKVNPFRANWYQMSRSRIKKSIATGGDLEPILAGIQELKNRRKLTPMQLNNRNVSIEAMQRFLSIKIPKIFNNPITVVKNVQHKSINIQGVEVIISPDLIFRAEIDGLTYYGAIKLHISKNNVFDRTQSKQVAAALYKFMDDNVKESKGKVLPEFCISLDVFGDKFTSAPKNFIKCYGELERVCEEIKFLWPAA